MSPVGGELTYRPERFLYAEFSLVERIYGPEFPCSRDTLLTADLQPPERVLISRNPKHIIIRNKIPFIGKMDRVMIQHFSRLSASTALVSIMLASNAIAQEAPESGRTGGLDVIMVTAERVETDLQTTPVAVTALNAESLQQLGAQGIEDLRAFVPNLTISEEGDYGRMNPQFNIRGVGAGVVTSGVVTEKPVGLYVDGIYLARAQGSLLSVIDADRIEVLRGPQGTLFGRNTTGGAVSYFSKMPGSEFEGSVNLTAGNFGRRDIKVDVNLPLAEGVYARGVFYDSQVNGFVDRGTVDMGNRDERVYRGQLRLEPSADITIDISGTHSTFASNGDARVITEFVINDGLQRGHFKALDTLLRAAGAAPLVTNDPRMVQQFSAPAFCILDDTDPFTTGPECEHPLVADMTLISGTITWDVSDNLTIKSLTGYLEGSQLASTDFPWSGAYKRPFEISFESFQQEVQAVYETDKLNLVTGAIYYEERGQEEEITIELAQGIAPLFAPESDILAGNLQFRRNEIYINETESFGLFAQATYSITEDLKVTGGIRYSKDTKDVSITYLPSEDDPRNVAGTGSESWDSIDWRGALSYQLTDDVMVYASVSKAYKAGVAIDSSLENRSNINNLIAFVEPEEALGYEVGIRSEWFDRVLRVNLTAFKTDYTNRQGAVLREVNGVLFFDTQNLGNVKFKGFEGEFALAATDNLTFNASFGLVDYRQVLNPLNTLAYVPEASFSIGVVHDYEFPNGATLTSSLNYGWNGEMWAENDQVRNEALPAQARVPSYGILNGRLDYTPEHGNWSIGLFANNITDEYYFTSTSPQQFHFGSAVTRDFGTIANLGRPRNYGVSASLNF